MNTTNMINPNSPNADKLREEEAAKASEQRSPETTGAGAAPEPEPKHYKLEGESFQRVQEVFNGLKAAHKQVDDIMEAATRNFVDTIAAEIGITSDELQAKHMQLNDEYESLGFYIVERSRKCRHNAGSALASILADVLTKKSA